MNKIWLNNYPKGVCPVINPEQYDSLVAVIDQSCKKNHNRIAFTHEGTTLSYAQFYKYASEFGAYLQQNLGLKKGDRIAIMMPNLLQYPVVIYGALQAGVIIVNINPLYTTDELSYVINDSGAQTIVVLSNFAATIAQLPSQTGLKAIIITKPGDLMKFPKGQIVNMVARQGQHDRKLAAIAKVIYFKTVLSIGKQLKLQAVNLSSSDLACIQYTGGTTGRAKGAMLTHRNLVANLEQIYEWMKLALNKEGEPALNKEGGIFITALPLYHILSFVANLLLSIRIGYENLLVTDPRDIFHLVKQLKKIKVSVFIGVQTLFKQLLNNTRFKELNFSHLKLALNGGMALEKQTAQRWEQITKIPLVQGYGLTEASPVVTVERFDREKFTGSIGLPLPSTEISIVDQNNHNLPIGQRGELCVKGPQVMLGYWQRPEETKEVLLADGWLKTGDIAKIDKVGNVYLLDRIKNMIVVSGFNVYPVEVENIINSCPGVSDSAVIGIPSEHSGEQVKAFVVKGNLSLTQGKIIEHCRAHLTKYKIPKKVEFVDKIPKSVVGKILHYKLRGAKPKSKRSQSK